MEDPDDLDDILDSALDDFRNVDRSQRAQITLDKADCSKEIVASIAASAPVESGQSTVGQGLGFGLPSLSATKRKTGLAKGKGLVNSRDASSRSGTAAFTNDSHLSETLEKLAEQTNKSLEGLDAAGDNDALGEKLVESLVKEFEELGGSQDMQSIVDTMMHQLLSKEVLHEPMKEIGEKYPKWLETNKSKLSKEDHLRYSMQYELIKQLCQVYETDPGDFQKIIGLMQNMQECGQPPSAIVQELAPGLELGEDGLPLLSELLPGDEHVAGQNCTIM
eukprot:c23895_g2_i1 orf=259-1089(+)